MKAAVTTAIAVIAIPAAASALTITNKSASEHAIGLDMGHKESVHKVPAGQSVTFKSECNDGCGVTGPWNYSVMLKTGDKYEFDGTSPISGKSGPS